jgi:cystathionine gamma-synthase
MSDAGRRFATEIVHGGEQRDQYQGALLTPIVRSAPYVFETLEALDRHASGEATCWEYARTAHPTGRVAEAKLAALEGAEDAVVFASGMAAITGTYLALLRQGDHLLVTDDGYKRTLMFARDTLPRWGVEGELVDSRDPLNAVRRALRPNTRLVLVEMPTNPHLRLVDLRALADLCHQAGALLAVDSTLASPVNLRPLALGADLVLHSATKFLAGHNDVLAGVVCGPADLITTIRDMHVNLGAILDPEGCYLLLRGLKTLGVRLARSNASALALAQWLAEQPQVAQVYYPGLPSDPGYELAQAQMASGGSLVSFELRSDLAGVARFVDALEVIALGTSLGGVESLLLHLGVLLRHGLTPEDRARLGLTDQLLRLSVGLEDPGDLLADLARGLAAMG